MTTKVADFRAIKLKLASPEEILSWSHGEVLKPETINYRTQKPEKDGLFCERIFGPEKDWECYCGKYRRIRYKGVICDKCGVEVTRSIVRRERMGHIKLAAPVCHIWFLRGVPSKIGLFLDISVQELEKVIYFASYLIVKVDEAAQKKAKQDLLKEYKNKLKLIKRNRAEKIKLEEDKNKAMAELNSLASGKILSEIEYWTLSQKYGQVFEAKIGAEAIKKVLEEVDLKKLRETLKNKLTKSKGLGRKKILKRLKLTEGMIRVNLRPEWMILTVLPVMPPDLRPMVALDGGRYATSDLNDLYRRVINRNNRLKKLIELNAPEVICRNEKRMLQEAVDALIDNSARRGQGPVMATTGQRRQLKSLADMLKGKQGRFRQNLLGKRVDYSGRSVIVIGPELKIDQCGLPKKMALELFKPFVIQKLVERDFAHNIRGAGRLIEEETDKVWEILEEIIAEKYVLLNRAPTLHRLGIQAFKPILIEGNAIQVHPMICRAFNADFDGDQMAVHLPLTEEAQREAKEILFSAKNLLKPATGEPIVIPTQDIILGCFWMTKIESSLKGEGKVFASGEEAILAYQFGHVHLKSPIKVRIKNQMVETCVGRVIFNLLFPPEFDFVNKEMNKKNLNSLVAELIEKLEAEKISAILDKIKELGLEYATLSGLSWGMDDLVLPEEKQKLLADAERTVETIHHQYLDGLLTRDERRSQIIETWFSVVDEVGELVPKTLDPAGPVSIMVSSGSRGSWGQTAQMAGLKGLVTNPAGEIIELPVKSSFKEGLNVLEYFISTHGGRKGTADTALRTSSAGYLTRRLIDVAQDVVIREKDCGDKKGIYIFRVDGEQIGQSFASRIFGRVSLESIYREKPAGEKKWIIRKGQLIDKKLAREINQTGIEKIRVRSVITCQTEFGLCQMCYGYDLGNNKLVKLGEAVGIVTAQAIGEPGTQLTMRTFHTGGVAGGGDITQGLPRVEEIFEARSPHGRGIISEIDGKVVDIKVTPTQKIIRISPEVTITKPRTFLAPDAKASKFNKVSAKKVRDKKEIKEYSVSPRAGLWVKEGDLVTRGQQLSEGHLDLRELYRVAGQEVTQRYIIKEVQGIYTAQGESINDKHIEIIVRQMFSRIRIKDPGDTNLLADAVIERSRLKLENDKAKKLGKRPAKAQQLLMGISRSALTTESWLSAASFQETTRVLIDAAIQAKEDKLRGLKENVIIGKLIPAGTGFRKIDTK